MRLDAAALEALHLVPNRQDGSICFTLSEVHSQLVEKYQSVWTVEPMSDFHGVTETDAVDSSASTGSRPNW